MDKILIGCFGSVGSDPRPNRFATYLYRNGFKIDILSNVIFKTNQVNFKFDFIKTKNFTQNNFLLKFCLLTLRKIIPFEFIKDSINKLIHGLYGLNLNSKQSEYMIGICEDIYLLPFFCHLKKKKIIKKIIFDAREFYPQQFEDSLRFNLFEKAERFRICSKFLMQCDEVLTVSSMIAMKYNNIFNINSKVFLSTPFYQNITFRETSNQIKLVHHGVANSNRGLEKMIEIVADSEERFTLDMFLTGNEKYIKYLRDKIKTSRIRILPPIEHNLIIETISNYDLGFFYVEPTTVNLQYCLPNKLFEFIQARLAVLIGPSPEMMKIVEEHDIGFISKEFSLKSMKELLSTIKLSDIDNAKSKSEIAAKELCFENQIKKIEYLFK